MEEVDSDVGVRIVLRGDGIVAGDGVHEIYHAPSVLQAPPRRLGVDATAHVLKEMLQLLSQPCAQTEEQSHLLAQTTGRRQ